MSATRTTGIRLPIALTAASALLACSAAVAQATGGDAPVAGAGETSNPTYPGWESSTRNTMEAQQNAADARWPNRGVEGGANAQVGGDPDAAGADQEQPVAGAGETSNPTYPGWESSSRNTQEIQQNAADARWPNRGLEGGANAQVGGDPDTALRAGQDMVGQRVYNPRGEELGQVSGVQQDTTGQGEVVALVVPAGAVDDQTVVVVPLRDLSPQQDRVVLGRDVDPQQFGEMATAPAQAAPQG